MTKKKILTLAMTLSMVAILAIGGTIAYFTDTDNASNTFELGGVDITLTERAYVDGKWENIENPDGTAKLGQLDPGVVEYYNKCVFTINNEDDAYIRNYVAIESDEKVRENNIYKIWYCDEGANNPSEATKGDYRHGSKITECFENIEINDTKYDIYVFDTIANAIVETGDSFNTLTTVTLDADLDNADIEKLGETFEVYTFSEAIQASGLTFDAAMTALIGADNTLQAHATRLITSMIPTTPAVGE